MSNKNNFAIITDSCANLSDSFIDEHDIHILSLTYVVEGTEYVSYVKGQPTEYAKYYDMLRKKIHMTTSCVCREICEPQIRELLEAGQDVLYLGFSSSMSATCNIVTNTLKDLAKEFPSRKVRYSDTLSGALGQGALVAEAVRLRSEGCSVDRALEWIEDNKLRLVHLFTVDTLYYLYKGGRVRAGTCLIAGTLNIKPIMHLDNTGKMVPLGKVFGRKSSLAHIADTLAATITDPANSTVYVSHGDCEADAHLLIDLIKDRVKVKDFVLTPADLVVGAHGGPGIIAAFYFAQSRDALTERKSEQKQAQPESKSRPENKTVHAAE